MNGQKDFQKPVIFSKSFKHFVKKNCAGKLALILLSFFSGIGDFVLFSTEL